MRISDWSSDVCSSDLVAQVRRIRPRTLDDGQCGGFFRTPGSAPVQGRPVQPDLPAHHAGPEVRPAPQAAGQAAALGPCGRPRIQGDHRARLDRLSRSEEHTSELQSLLRTSYADFCLKKKTKYTTTTHKQ